MYHRSLAAGFDLGDVQLTITLSPMWYDFNPPDMRGPCPCFGKTLKKTFKFIKCWFWFSLMRILTSLETHQLFPFHCFWRQCWIRVLQQIFRNGRPLHYLSRHVSKSPCFDQTAFAAMKAILLNCPKFLTRCHAGTVVLMTMVLTSTFTPGSLKIVIFWSLSAGMKRKNSWSSLYHLTE